MLLHQRSPIRSAGLSQSVTTTASSSTTASHRSREATVVADAVRRLNKRMCLIDQVVCEDCDTDTMDTIVSRALESTTFPSLPLVKVHSVGNCVAYALLEAVGLFCERLINSS